MISEIRLLAIRPENGIAGSPTLGDAEGKKDWSSNQDLSRRRLRNLHFGLFLVFHCSTMRLESLFTG
jgi:hypothetical protein